MKKLMLSMGVVLSAMVFSAPAYCGGSEGKGPSSMKLMKKLEHKKMMYHKHDGKKLHHKTPVKDEVVQAPEIDGGQAGLALALLAGMLAVARERRKYAAK